jgi:ribosome-associated toxin RatA of RatAB toxin-antitoxin module
MRPAGDIAGGMPELAAPIQRRAWTVARACAIASPMLLAVLSLLAATENPNPWQEVAEDDGITVWAREVPDSNIREVKAEAIVNAPAERVWAVLADTQAYPEFMPYVLETKILGKHETGHFEYQRIDPPVVDMRDYAVRVVLEADPAAGKFKRSWSPANDKAPPLMDGVVRVQVNQGSWTIESVGSKQAHVEYYLYTDPGGAIPGWLANKANNTSVPTLMRAVRNRSIDPTWKRD